jgi:hypothetical protein
MSLYIKVWSFLQETDAEDHIKILSIQQCFLDREEGGISTLNSSAFLSATFSFFLIFCTVSLAFYFSVSLSAQETRSFRPEVIGNGNIDACANLIKGHKLFYQYFSCLSLCFCLEPDSSSSPSCVQLKTPTSTQDQLLLSLDRQMDSIRYLEENYPVRSSLISCLAGHTALLTTSSLTLLIYFLTRCVTQKLLAPQRCTDPHPRLLLYLFFSLWGSCSHPSSPITYTLLLEP